MKILKKKPYPRLFIITLLLVSFLAIYSLFNFQKTNKLGDSVKTDCQDCNVVLIVVDTLRQDHLTAYGYSKDITPALDKMSNQSLVFLNNYSASNWTLPSMISMFTGTYPQHHLVDNKYFFEFPEANVTLEKTAPHLLTMADYFQKSGYKTAGFTGGAGLASAAGFDKGFDVYDDGQDFVGFETTAIQAVDWLSKIDESDNDKHFLFLHGYDVHGQYSGSDKVERVFSSSYQGNLSGTVDQHVKIRDHYQKKGQILLNGDDKQFLIDHYDDKILAMDERLREFLLSYREEMNFENPTIFIITSDHGEEWFDHGGIDHGLTLYQEVVKTPLIIHLPGQTEQVNIKDKTSGVDLLPTILDLVKIPLKEFVEIDGTSFVPSINGVKSSNEVLFHSNYRHVTSLRGGINQNNEKIFVDLMEDRQGLYNLNKDSGEKNNLIFKNDSKKNNMLNWLGQFFWELNL